MSGADRVIGYSAIAGGPKAQISGNGRFVAFVSAANARNTLNSVTNLFLYDLQTETTTLVSFNRDRSGGGNGTSDSPSISSDGRYVGFRSSASDLAAGDTNGREDIFLFDRLTGTNRLVSLNQAGAGTGNDRSATPVISANGAVVAFRSLADDLVADDSNETQDVFVFRVPVVTFTDTDGDGMDDAWEMAYFGNLSRDGSGDFDGDDLSDLVEFRSGTDPMSKASGFRVQATVSLNTGQTTITWTAGPGRIYRAQYKDDLNETAWHNLSGGVGIDGNTGICVDNSAGDSNQRFYRVTLVE